MSKEFCFESVGAPTLSVGALPRALPGLDGGGVSISSLSPATALDSGVAATELRRRPTAVVVVTRVKHEVQ